MGQVNFVLRNAAVLAGLVVLLQGCILGRVLDPDGNPISGAEVTISNGTDSVTVTTDASGIYIYDYYADPDPVDLTEVIDGVVVSVAATGIEYESNQVAPFSGVPLMLCHLYEPIIATHRTLWNYNLDTEKFYTIVPDIYVSKADERDSFVFSGNCKPYVNFGTGDSQTMRPTLTMTA